MGARSVGGLTTILLRKPHLPRTKLTSSLLPLLRLPATSVFSFCSCRGLHNFKTLHTSNDFTFTLKFSRRMFCTQEQNSKQPDHSNKRKKRSETPQGHLRYGLDMCSKLGDFMEALNLYDKARAENISLTQHHYNVLLYLCSSAAMGVLKPSNRGTDRNEAKVEDPFEEPTKFNDNMKDLALKRGFEIYTQMGLDKIPPNEATFTAAARLAVANEDATLAFDLVKKMAEHGIPPKLRSYGPALLGFCKKRDADMAYEVDAHMAQYGVHPEEAELRALLKVSVEVFREDKVYSLLHRLRATVRQVSSTTLDVIEEWFGKEGVDKLGEADWDWKKVQDGVIAGGGGWHGQGWLGQGNWRMRHTTMDARGVCRSCGEQLVTVDIDPMETESFVRSVVALACEREAKAFEQFQEWLDRHGPFDAVVDGANVGLYKQTNTSFFQLNAVTNGIRQRSPSKKMPLIILHNRRARGGCADDPRNRQLIEKWRNADALYMTPTGSNDDWYWLYAAVRFKCLLVTNDEMRDHIFELLGNSFFPKWKERHQVRFSVKGRNLQLHMPPPYSIVIQESEIGSWHIPIVGGDDIDTPRDWLCITRDKLSELREHHNHGTQERRFQSYSQLSDFKHTCGQVTDKAVVSTSRR